MRVRVAQEGSSFRYQIEPARGDATEAARDFADAAARFRLARREFEVQRPAGAAPVHPDRHAAALYLILAPVIGSRLDLPFAVSAPFAERMHAAYGVRLRHAAKVAPVAAPPRPRPCLLVSGGMDSMAASAVFPPDTAHLFLDRIPHPELAASPDILVDLSRQREAAEGVSANGRELLTLRDDHERLFDPYPMWHSRMSALPGLYLADTVGVTVLDGGDVLDAVYLEGYYSGETAAWRFKPAHATTTHEMPLLEAAGLRYGQSICGLSEVATSIIANRSPYRGRTFSCYYPTADFFCMRCDKCFKKLLLRHIVDDEEIPAALIDHFLAFPYLARIFARPFFDWHHVWFYIFQRGRSSHWLFEELRPQAAAGPDLSLLEKWYPGSRPRMEPAYADALLEGISRYVATMSAREVKALESLDVPPLHVDQGRLKAAASGRARAAGGGAPVADGPPPLAEANPFEAFMRAAIERAPASQWGEFELDEVGWNEAGQMVQVAFHDDDSRVVLNVFRVRDGGPEPPLRVGRLGFGYRADAPADTEPKQRLMRGLARWVTGAIRAAGR